jgi:hypothetical protein
LLNAFVVLASTADLKRGRALAFMSPINLLDQLLKTSTEPAGFLNPDSC